MGAPGLRVAVVLAGGQSRRFGADKLAAPVEGRSLLDSAVAGLPADVAVLVVGPERPVSRPARFLREDPPGGGPAAAMVTGVAAALTAGAEHIAVLPGDAPHAGLAAGLLLDVLAASPGTAAVVGTDATGFDQPLQLALLPGAARQLVEAAGADGARGGSARALVGRLQPPAMRHRLPRQTSYDIDTPEQLRTWTSRSSGSAAAVLAAVDALTVTGRPVVVAVDGHSGAGKSTLATSVALRRDCVVVEGDGFYSCTLASLTWSQREQLSAQAVADAVIDWRRLRAEALEPLLRRRAVRYSPYDWQADDGRLGRPVTRAPADLVLVEGVYSARPELADLVDLAVCVEVPEDLRRRRRRERGNDPRWRDFWDRGERYYFTGIRPGESFDLRL